MMINIRILALFRFCVFLSLILLLLHTSKNARARAVLFATLPFIVQLYVCVWHVRVSLNLSVSVFMYVRIIILALSTFFQPKPQQRKGEKKRYMPRIHFNVYWCNEECWKI